MPGVDANPRRYDLRTFGLRRGLAFLLAFTLAVSGLFHGSGGGHASAAEDFPRHHILISQDIGAAPCCAENGADSHGASCGTAGCCSLCASLTTSTALAPSIAEPAVAMIYFFYPARFPTHPFRPPIVISNL